LHVPADKQTPFLDVGVGGIVEGGDVRPAGTVVQKDVEAFGTVG